MLGFTLNLKRSLAFLHSLNLDGYIVSKVNGSFAFSPNNRFGLPINLTLQRLFHFLHSVSTLPGRGLDYRLTSCLKRLIYKVWLTKVEYY